MKNHNVENEKKNLPCEVSDSSKITEEWQDEKQNEGMETAKVDQSNTTSLQNEYIPKTYDESLDIPHWKQAIKEELKALEANQTHDIVELPPMKKPIRFRWVFTSKISIR